MMMFPIHTHTGTNTHTQLLIISVNIKAKKKFCQMSAGHRLKIHLFRIL